MSLSEIEKTCPLCGKPNNCKHGNKDCWCNYVVIPKELIEQIPKDKRGIACICKECVDEHNYKML